MEEREGAVELSLDEDTEVLYKIDVQGSSKPPEVVRLVCEVGSVACSFKGKIGSDGVYSFVVPPMKETFVPGRMYQARVEVVVEDRYFVPATFEVEFKQPMRVVAEAVTKASNNPKRSTTRKTETAAVKVSAWQTQRSSLKDRYDEKTK